MILYRSALTKSYLMEKKKDITFTPVLLQHLMLASIIPSCCVQSNSICHRLYCLKFSFCCRYVLCTSGDLVKVYSTRTEEWIHTLQGHTNQITGIALNPANHLQVCFSWVNFKDICGSLLCFTFHSMV